MAWNPSPEVAAARDIAAKLGDADQVIVIHIKYATDTMGLVTYGKTKALCAEAKGLGDKAYEAVRDALGAVDA